METPDDLRNFECKCGQEINIMSKIHGVNIGKAMRERVETGRCSKDRIEQFEDQWMKKIACMDEVHSQYTQLNIASANSFIRKLTAYAEGGNDLPCFDFKEQLLKCLTQNQQNTLECSCQAEKFRNCVDNMMYTTSRMKYPDPARKPTYTERFFRTDDP